MFRVAGLGDQAVLVSVAETWILVGCPPDAGGHLSRLGVQAEDVAAVLVASGTSMDGWPLFRRRARPRLVGTEPMLQAARDHLKDAALWRPITGEGDLFSMEEVEEAFRGAEEVSYHQEVLLEGERTIIASAVCSGLGLGGSLWILELAGLRLALGALGLQPPRSVDADALVLLGSLGLATASSIEEQIEELCHEAVRVVAQKGNLLVPLQGTPEAYAEEIMEGIAKAISGQEKQLQVPIYAVGSPARRLRRCGRYGEWASKKCQARAHRGEHPFLVDPLLASGRLFLAETLKDLEDTYEEPCVVLASMPMAKHFEKLWASQSSARRLGEGGTMTGVGKALQVYISARELATMTAKLVLRRRLRQGKALSEAMELKDELQQVPLDLSRCRVQLWLPRNLIASARQQGRKRPADVLPLHGTLLGRSRPRVTGRHPADELLAGSVDVEALRKAFQKAGLQVEGKEEMVVPSLNARIWLNQADGNALETVIECQNPEGRRRIAKVVDSVLMAF